MYLAAPVFILTSTLLIFKLEEILLSKLSENLQRLYFYKVKSKVKQKIRNRKEYSVK